MNYVKAFICRLLFIDVVFENRIKRLESRILFQEDDMATVKELLDKLVAENNDLKTVNESVSKTFATMNEALKVALSKAVDDNDLSVLQNLVDEFDKRGTELSASVTANTPAASEPAPATPATPVTTDTPLTGDSSSTPAPTPASSDNSAGNTPAASEPAPAASEPAPAQTTQDGSTPNT